MPLAIAIALSHYPTIAYIYLILGEFYVRIKMQRWVIMCKSPKLYRPASRGE